MVLSVVATVFLLFLFRDAIRPALQTVCSESGTWTKHDPERLGAGGSDPTTFWADRLPKSGVAPALFDVFSTVAFAVPGFVCRRFPRTSDLLRMKKWQFQKMQNALLTFFTRCSLNRREEQSVAARTCQSRRCAACHSFQPPAGFRFR